MEVASDQAWAGFTSSAPASAWTRCELGFLSVGYQTQTPARADAASEAAGLMLALMDVSLAMAMQLQFAYSRR